MALGQPRNATIMLIALLGYLIERLNALYEDREYNY